MPEMRVAWLKADEASTIFSLMATHVGTNKKKVEKKGFRTWKGSTFKSSLRMWRYLVCLQRFVFLGPWVDTVASHPFECGAFKARILRPRCARWSPAVLTAIFWRCLTGPVGLIDAKRLDHQGRSMTHDPRQHFIPRQERQGLLTKFFEDLSTALNAKYAEVWKLDIHGVGNMLVFGCYECYGGHLPHCHLTTFIFRLSNQPASAAGNTCLGRLGMSWNSVSPWESWETWTHGFATRFFFGRMDDVESLTLGRTLRFVAQAVGNLKVLGTESQGFEVTGMTRLDIRHWLVFTQYVFFCFSKWDWRWGILWKKGNQVPFVLFLGLDCYMFLESAKFFWPRLMPAMLQRPRLSGSQWFMILVIYRWIREEICWCTHLRTLQACKCMHLGALYELCRGSCCGSCNSKRRRSTDYCFSERRIRGLGRCHGDVWS